MIIFLIICSSVSTAALFVAYVLCRMSRLNHCPSCYCLHNRFGETVRLIRPVNHIYRLPESICAQCLNDQNRPFKTCNHYE